MWQQFVILNGFGYCIHAFCVKWPAFEHILSFIATNDNDNGHRSTTQTHKTKAEKIKFLYPTDTPTYEIPPFSIPVVTT